jgi:hypothetical protein
MSERDDSEVPGVVLAHSPGESEKYIGSPSIIVLEDGTYLASHDFFGPGTNFDRGAVYRSEDRGETWSHLTDMVGQWWSGMFLHRGDLYTIGTTREYGYAVIRRSKDGGRTWTEPTDLSNGILSTTDRYHCAPMPVVEHNGRLWRAFELAYGKRPHWPATVCSASVDADLLSADSWTWADPYHHFWSAGQWIEGNVVITPDGTLVDILRANVGATAGVDEEAPGEFAAMIRISDDGTRLSHNRETDLLNFPGGGVKFTIRYDQVSGKYWSLGSKQTNPPAQRNTLVMTSSSDLFNWTIESTLLHHDDPIKHAFQYVDWLIEEDDMIVLSRTAYEDGLGGANRGHDANYLTFHRVNDFRERTENSELLG